MAFAPRKLTFSSVYSKQSWVCSFLSCSPSKCTSLPGLLSGMCLEGIQRSSWEVQLWEQQFPRVLVALCCWSTGWPKAWTVWTDQTIKLAPGQPILSLNKIAIAWVKIPDPFLIPASWSAACRQLLRVLAPNFPERTVLLWNMLVNRQDTVYNVSPYTEKFPYWEALLNKCFSISSFVMLMFKYTC